MMPSIVPVSSLHEGVRVLPRVPMIVSRSRLGEGGSDPLVPLGVAAKAIPDVQRAILVEQDTLGNMPTGVVSHLFERSCRYIAVVPELGAALVPVLLEVDHMKYFMVQ